MAGKVQWRAFTKEAPRQIPFFCSLAQMDSFSIHDQWKFSFDKENVVKAFPVHAGVTNSHSQLSISLKCAHSPRYHPANTMLLMFSTDRILEVTEGVAAGAN